MLTRFEIKQKYPLKKSEKRPPFSNKKRFRETCTVMEIRYSKYPNIIRVRRDNVYHIVRLIPHIHPINLVLSILLQIYYPFTNVPKDEMQTILQFALPSLSLSEFFKQARLMYYDDASTEGMEVKSYIEKVRKAMRVT